MQSDYFEVETREQGRKEDRQKDRQEGGIKSRTLAGDA